MSTYNHGGKDLYRILRVTHTATTQEIKVAYRKLAMELHPDKNNGCPKKNAQFQEVSEAYSILLDKSKRKQFDSSQRVNKNRSSPLPKDYRKIVFPQPPPDWKFTWDHARHYDMHYGDGFMREAFNEVKRNAEKEGFYNYRSSLGRGFSFSSDPIDTGSNNLHHNRNPYSKKTDQGPPKIQIVYDEGDLSTTQRGKVHVNNRDKIVDELHERRNARRREDQIREEKMKQDRRYRTSSTANKSKNSNPDPSESSSCVIL